MANLVYDVEGRLWVEVHDAGGVRYDIYDDAGNQLASVTGLPPSGEVDPAFIGDRVAILLPEDGGFPRIGVYRIGGAQ